MAKADRAAAIKVHLEAEGYRPEIDRDGDVMVMHEGRTFYIEAVASDEVFYRVFHLYFWPVDGDAELERAYRAAHEVGLTVKVAKVFVSEGQAIATAELYGDSVHAILPILTRAIRATQAAASKFAEVMRGF